MDGSLSDLGLAGFDRETEYLARMGCEQVNGVVPLIRQRQAPFSSFLLGRPVAYLPMTDLEPPQLTWLKDLRLSQLVERHPPYAFADTALALRLNLAQVSGDSETLLPYALVQETPLFAELRHFLNGHFRSVGWIATVPCQH